MVTNTETGPPRVIKEDIAYPPAGQTGNSIAFTMGPDDIKVELVEKPQQASDRVAPRALLRAAEQRDAGMVREDLGAEPRPGANFPSADLPGVALNFSPSTTPVVGTQGRALDHIGFEVQKPRGIRQEAGGQGIKLNTEYRKVPALNIAIAFFTDPWGTYIELTEGLGRVTIATN